MEPILRGFGYAKQATVTSLAGKEPTGLKNGDLILAIGVAYNFTLNKYPTLRYKAGSTTVTPIIAQKRVEQETLQRVIGAWWFVYNSAQGFGALEEELEASSSTLEVTLVAMQAGTFNVSNPIDAVAAGWSEVKEGGGGSIAAVNGAHAEGFAVCVAISSAIKELSGAGWATITETNASGVASHAITTAGQSSTEPTWKHTSGKYLDGFIFVVRSAVEVAIRSAPVTGGGNITTVGGKVEQGIARVTGGGNITTSAEKVPLLRVRDNQCSGGGNITTVGGKIAPHTAKVLGGGNITTKVAEAPTAAGPPIIEEAAAVHGGGNITTRGNVVRIGVARVVGGGNVTTISTETKVKDAPVHGGGGITTRGNIVRVAQVARVSGGGSLTTTTASRHGGVVARVSGGGLTRAVVSSRREVSCRVVGGGNVTSRGGEVPPLTEPPGAMSIEAGMTIRVSLSP
jgi:hypothetical protein